MGKKGSKRKTRWRALPLGEEVGGSGNEEEQHDEDQSTASSVIGQPTNNSYKRQSIYYKMGEKPFRQTKRFPYDRYRSKEPLVKLESKTFDEEEYTKITTPRQDVLFKKGCFGRKRESSVEETVRYTGEMDSEEPIMDQLIITNGFVDERGHYLVNGNSYEIYDPYSNTVTVVVGPPPYTNGVTQPVLAAVSCQPVPLQPVEWYPPGSDWPSQGSAWTPSYHHSPNREPLNSPGQNENAPNYHGPEGEIPNIYQPAYVVPGYIYSESPIYNGVPVQTNNVNSTTETLCSNENELENKLKKTRRKSEELSETDNVENNKPPGEDDKSQKCDECPVKAEETIETESSKVLTQENTSEEPETKVEEEMVVKSKGLKVEGVVEFQPTEAKPVEKQSHSTQTNLETSPEIIKSTPEVPKKESHSTQTPPEETFPSNNIDLKTFKENQKNESNNNSCNVALSTPQKTEQESKVHWKSQQNRCKEYYNTSPKKFQEDSPKKIYQKRTNFSEEKKLKIENFQKTYSKIDSSPPKISYAKKAMAGLENTSIMINTKANDVNPTTNARNKIANGYKNAQTPVVNGTNQVLTTNGTNKANYNKQIPNHRYDSTEEKKTMNGNVRNGYVKTRYNQISPEGKVNEQNSQKETRKYKDKVQLKPFEVASDKKSEIKEKCDEIITESRSQSEKSSTVSDLSSPTELSSGQNTPPEKLIVRKMEQKIANEINKSFEEKLKQNLTKRTEEVNETVKDEEKPEEKIEEKTEEVEEPVEEKKQKPKSGEGKKKKNKTRTEEEKPKESTKPTKSKKKKKTNEESKESKEKSESDNSSEDIKFLPNFIGQKPQDLLFGSWEGNKNSETDIMSELDFILNGDDEVLKSLGISEDKLNFSKLPLHSDLLTMLPTFGWARPRLKIEDIFAPTKLLHNDLFTKRNITNMKSTKPEEFFASVVDYPTIEKADKKKETNKNGKKDTTKTPEVNTLKTEPVKETKSTPSIVVKKNVNLTKTGYKVNKNNVKSKVDKEESEESKIETTAEPETEAETETEKEKEKEKEMEVEKEPEPEPEPENKRVKLGIVEAVNTWLQEQVDSKKVLYVESLPALDGFEQKREVIEEDENDDEPDQKNGTGNPMHALSVNGGDSISLADFREGNGCMRVAGKVNEFTHLDKRENPWKCRMYRSSSWDAKLSDVKIKKHFKFLTESASFYQDLISDIRTGLPAKNEYATEELCDPKQSVSKYYTLSPKYLSRKGKTVHESDSENEVFEALEYKFLTKENLSNQEAERKSPNDTGNVSVTDSGVQSDLECSEDTANEHQKEPNCKLQ